MRGLEPCVCISADGWLRGRKRTVATCVYRKVPGVRIPHLPPLDKNWGLTALRQAAIVLTTNGAATGNAALTTETCVPVVAMAKYLRAMQGLRVQISLGTPNTSAEVRKVGVLIGLENRDGYKSP
jgi:hypothetical protein